MAPEVEVEEFTAVLIAAEVDTAIATAAAVELQAVPVPPKFTRHKHEDID